MGIMKALPPFFWVILSLSTYLGASSVEIPQANRFLESVLLRNPAGFIERMEFVPVIKVSKAREYDVTVEFQGDPAFLEDLSRLRRIGVFQRTAKSKCMQRECWSRVALINSRYGPKQTVKIRPASTEILVVLWHIADGSKNRAGEKSGTGCFALPCARIQSGNSSVLLRLNSPYGSSNVTIALTKAPNPVGQADG